MEQLFEVAGGLVPVLLWIVGICLGLLVLYLVLRAAVRHALRQHQEWLEERGLR